MLTTNFPLLFYHDRKWKLHKIIWDENSIIIKHDAKINKKIICDSPKFGIVEIKECLHSPWYIILWMYPNDNKLHMVANALVALWGISSNVGYNATYVLWYTNHILDVVCNKKIFQIQNGGIIFIYLSYNFVDCNVTKRNMIQYKVIMFTII
jgi:hypothetical protein